MEQRTARDQETRRLEAQHTPESIRRRVYSQDGQGYTRDAVLGAIDGSITTFAIVAGTLGAGFPPLVTVVLGTANLLADGFSMAASEFQATRADSDEVNAARAEEQHHIDRLPQSEREEVRQIYRKKGFDGELLEGAVDMTTRNRDTWVNTMITDELGLQPRLRSPGKAAVTTFCGFTAAGVIPLIPFLVPFLITAHRFEVSVGLTALVFALVGMYKGLVYGISPLKASAETLLTGSVASVLAYAAGYLLRQWYGRGIY